MSDFQEDIDRKFLDSRERSRQRRAMQAIKADEERRKRQFVWLVRVVTLLAITVVILVNVELIK